MLSPKLTRFLAAGAAAVAVATGGLAIANSSSSNGVSGTANAAQVATPGQAPQSGQVPPNWQPGTGTIITGTAADKAKAAALAAKYQGTVNRVLKLSDGSYVVHLIATSGPHHVFVSTDFKVMGSA
jgi:succinate dehydrogenase/fumarate reductase flavoprotein subunit